MRDAYTTAICKEADGDNLFFSITFQPFLSM